MSESNEGVAVQNDEPKGKAPRKRRNRLLQRAARERWPISKALRASAMKCLHETIETSKEPRDTTSAVRAALAASKLNQQNVLVTIKTRLHTDMERRLKELEDMVQKRIQNSAEPRRW